MGEALLALAASAAALAATAPAAEPAAAVALAATAFAVALVAAAISLPWGPERMVLLRRVRHREQHVAGLQ